MMVGVLELPDYGSSISHRHWGVGRGMDWIGAGFVGEDWLCCGGCMFAGTALLASCRSTVLRWRALHGDRIAPLWRC